MSNHLNYFEYLKSRSLKGLIYRNFVVYPKICNCIQGRLLDLGCGIGDMLKFYPNSVGVDINPYTVEFCNKSGLKAFLIDSDKLPFKPESFDTILLDNVLEHIQEPSNLLFEISRVLKKPGQLIIGLPGDKGFLMDIDHKFNYKKADLLPLLENVGMKIVSEFFTPFKSNFLNKVFKRYCVYYVAIKS